MSVVVSDGAEPRLQSARKQNKLYFWALVRKSKVSSLGTADSEDVSSTGHWQAMGGQSARVRFLAILNNILISNSEDKGMFWRIFIEWLCLCSGRLLRPSGQLRPQVEAQRGHWQNVARSRPRRSSRPSWSRPSSNCRSVMYTAYAFYLFISVNSSKFSLTFRFKFSLSVLTLCLIHFLSLIFTKQFVTFSLEILSL